MDFWSRWSLTSDPLAAWRRGALLAIDRDPQAIAVAKTIDDRASPSSTDLSPRWANTLPSASYRQDRRHSPRSWRLFTATCDAERGFSFMRDGPLDMRMDQPVGSQPLNGYKPQKKPISPGIENLW